VIEKGHVKDGIVDCGTKLLWLASRSISKLEEVISHCFCQCAKQIFWELWFLCNVGNV
jgi:hypothetical protein